MIPIDSRFPPRRADADIFLGAVMFLRSLSLVTLLGLNLLLSGCGHAPGHADASSSSAELLVPVTPIKPLRKTLTKYVEQPGQITPLEETPIWAKVSGYVDSVAVDIGDRVAGPKRDASGKIVEPGQVLMTISVPELEKELAEKTAAVSQALSFVKQSEAAVGVAAAARESAVSAIAETKAGVERAEAEYVRWKSELDRFAELADRQAVTKKLVEETQSKLAAAAADRKQVAAKIQSAEAHEREAAALLEKARADLDASQARVELAQAERDRIATLLEYAVIRAPYDGIVSARNVDTGHLVSSSAGDKAPLLTIVNAQTVRIVVDVPEIDSVHVKPDAEAVIVINSLRREPFQAKVTRTTWVLNDATRTLRAEIDLPNPDLQLRPGLYAVARLKVAERQEVLTLPKTALMTIAGQTSCWLIPLDGKLVRQPVVPGLEVAGEVEITSGLTGDEQLIGLNAAAFREGQSVEIAGTPGKK